MSFSAADLQRWLGDLLRGVRRGDGSVWTDLEALAGVHLSATTLDSRQARAGSLFVGVAGERTHGALHLAGALAQGAAAALVEGEPNWGTASVPVLMVEDARSALRAIGRGYLASFGPDVVGITGSNGKTTTKDYTRAALTGSLRVGASPGNLNSGWGLPLAILAQDGDEAVVVLEMGASAPGEIAALVEWTRPRIGCITNIAPAHLEGFGSVDAVADTKAAMVTGLPADGVAILPADDPRFEWLKDRTSATTQVAFGWSPRAEVRITRAEQTTEGLAITINGHAAILPVFGEANVWNAAAAYAIAIALGVDGQLALDRMQQADLSPHRSRVFRHHGRVVVDDCYNANPRSMTLALESLVRLPVAGARWAVLGSMGELGPDSARFHAEVVERAAELGVDRLVPVGDAMRVALREGWSQAPDTPTDVVELGRYLAVSSAKEDALLFKGSRSAGLERVMDAMLANLEPAGNGV